MSMPVGSDSLIVEAPFRIELVRVPAGEFLMGSDPARDKFAEPDEMPMHHVYLPEFHIGRYEITNRQFIIYAQNNGSDFGYTVGKDDYPAVRISWEEAVVFCEWLSQSISRHVRLPTEAEWEKAARGIQGSLYPWGDNWDRTLLNSNDGGVGDITPVDRYTPAGDSLFGTTDMVGNVWEWTADWYNENTYMERAKAGVWCRIHAVRRAVHTECCVGAHTSSDRKARALPIAINTFRGHAVTILVSG